MSNSEYRANRKRLTQWIYAQESEQHLGDIKESGKERAGKRKKALYFEHDSIPSKFMKLKDDKFTSINNINFVGLQNKKNNCWLNSLVQRINCLPVKNCLLDAIKEPHISPLSRALTNILSKMS